MRERAARRGSRAAGSARRAERGSEKRLSALALTRQGNAGLLRGGGERRQFADIARVVLDDDGRLQIGGDLLHALERSHGCGAVVIEARHAVAVVVLVEMREISHQDDVAFFLQLYEERAVAGRMPGR